MPLAPIEYDPDMHHIADLPVAKSLRAATGIPSLITYRHAFHKSWVLGFRSEDGRMLLEALFLNETDETSDVVSRERFQEIVKTLREMITEEEATKRRRSRANARVDGILAAGEEMREGVAGIFESIRRSYGPLAAEDYRRSCGLTLPNQTKVSVGT